MSSLSLMIKPVSSSCNLNCSYCFYRSDSKLRSVPNYGFMQKETLEFILKQAFSFAEGSVSIVFQGGEPALRGLDFFKSAAEYINKYKASAKNVSVSIQTNGTLLNESWCEFLKKEKWLVGLSLDGTKALHDKYRLYNSGSGTLNQALYCAKLLQKFNINFNILTVVTNETAEKTAAVYSFLKRNGFLRQQYIPCISSFNEENKFLSAAAYGDFLCRLFDLWFKDRMSGFPIYIRRFENYIAMLNGRMPNECGMTGQCADQYMIEADGSVFPCDFYSLDEFKLGAIKSFEELEKSGKRLSFIEDSLSINMECAKCRYYFICRNGCKRNRERALNGISKNAFCLSYKRFFEYALDRLMYMTKVL